MSPAEAAGRKAWADGLDDSNAGLRLTEAGLRPTAPNVNDWENGWFFASKVEVWKV